MKKSLKWSQWFLGLSLLGIVTDVQGVNIYLRSGTTTCLYDTITSQTLQLAAGPSQSSIAFSARTNTFSFYTAPLTNATFVASSKTVEGTIAVQNNGTADFQFQASVTVYDYDPATGNQSQIVAGAASSWVNVGKNGKAGKASPPGTAVGGSGYTIPAGHMMKADITIVVNLSTGINGALLYNASTSSGKSIVQFPKTGFTWPFGNFTAVPDATIISPSSVTKNSTNNVASVRDAGAGAAYSWTITNGTITAGQYTREITWTAGSAGSIGLGVIVVNGCRSAGSTSIITVNAKTNQTIDFNPIPAHTYGDAPFALSATASSGLPVAFTVVSGPATVLGGTLTLTGAGTVIVDAIQGGDTNYNPAITEQSFVVDPKPLAVAGITAANKVYDGTTDATLDTNNAMLAGILAGDVVDLDITFVSGDYADKTAGLGKIINISGLDLIGTDASKYTLGNPTTTADIAPAGLTVTGVTASDKIYDGTANVALNSAGAALIGVISGDVVALDSGSGVGAFADKNVGAAKAVTISGLALSGADAANYTLTQPAATANITPAILTIIATANSKTYDGNSSASATPTISGLVGSDAVTGLAEAYDTKNVGTGKTLNVSAYTVSDGNGGNNYTISTLASTAGVITPAVLLIQADNKSKFSGQPNPDLTATCSGFVNGENAGVLTSPVVLSTTATVSSPAGEYPITASGAAAANYAINYADGKLRIGAMPQLNGRSARINGDTRFIIGWSTVSGHNYQLEYTDDLGAGWQTLGTPVAGTDAMVYVTNNVSGAARRFFRLGVQ